MDTDLPTATDGTASAPTDDDPIRIHINLLEIDVLGWEHSLGISQHVDHKMLATKVTALIYFVLMLILDVKGMEGMDYVNDLKRVDALIQTTLRILNTYGTTYKNEVTQNQSYSAICKKGIAIYEDLEVALVACDMKSMELT